MTPEISVVMSTYNNEATIRAAVASILDQSCGDFELLIVNDGSTDHTAAILGEYTDPRIRLLHNSANIGLTRSLNRAIAVSRGRLIARQDADDVSMPERFAKQLRFMNEHPEVALLGTSRATLNSAGKVISTTQHPAEPDYRRLLRSNCFAHGSIVVRRAVLDDIGPYNEMFKLSQDYELWLRIAKRYRIANLPEPLYGVRRHSNRVTLSKLPQAMLFRRLAVNLSRGEVSQDVLERIGSKGVEVYYDDLSIQDKLKFHRAASAKYAKYRFYAEAEYHLQKLIEMKPCSPGARLRLVKVSLLRRWQTGARSA